MSYLSVWEFTIRSMKILYENKQYLVGTHNNNNIFRLWAAFRRKPIRIVVVCCRYSDDWQ